MWQLEWDLSLRPSGLKAPNLPLSHHAPLVWFLLPVETGGASSTRLLLYFTVKPAMKPLWNANDKFYIAVMIIIIIIITTTTIIITIIIMMIIVMTILPVIIVMN